MPNISFDIFFDQDFINITATRTQGVPKVKPEWKVRTAPKLPPKEVPALPKTATPRPVTKLQRPRIQGPPASKPSVNGVTNGNQPEANGRGNQKPVANGKPAAAPKSLPKPKESEQSEVESEQTIPPKAKPAPKKDAPKSKSAKPAAK